ncbi:MAG TPA: hypothetical protein VGI66_06325 [Streptosporangiaceae bacterium]
MVADHDLMFNTLNGYRTFLAGEGWTAPEGIQLPPWNPIKDHPQQDMRQLDPGTGAPASGCGTTPRRRPPCVPPRRSTAAIPWRSSS